MFAPHLRSWVDPRHGRCIEGLPLGSEKVVQMLVMDPAEIALLGEAGVLERHLYVSRLEVDGHSLLVFAWRVGGIAWGVRPAYGIELQASLADPSIGIVVGGLVEISQSFIPGEVRRWVKA